MMLSTALTQMMDKCECLLFLNTKNSNWNECFGEEVQTVSPWIYHELSTMKVLRSHLDRPSKIRKKRVFVEDSVPAIIHNVSIKDIPEISMTEFLQWLCSLTDVKGGHLLDLLYSRYSKLQLDEKFRG